LTTQLDFTFRMERINGRCRNLIYEEAGNQLIIGLEISGVRKFDWVGTDTSFEKWTVPKEELIPESKRREILNRLAEWGQANRLRIDIGPPVSMEEMYADYEKKAGRSSIRPMGPPWSLLPSGKVC
jgi:hypothetical protein